MSTDSIYRLTDEERLQLEQLARTRRRSAPTEVRQNEHGSVAVKIAHGGGHHHWRVVYVGPHDDHRHVVEGGNLTAAQIKSWRPMVLAAMEGGEQ